MLTALLLSSMAFAEPNGSEDIACFIQFEGVVPTAGSTDVPVDTLIRVLPTGESCGDNNMRLNLTEAGTALDQIETTFEIGKWVEFPQVELKADTSYVATFDAFDGYLEVAFTTSALDAPAPLTPTFSILSLQAQEYEGQIGIFMNAAVEGDVKDTSGFSTMRVFLADRFDFQFPAPTGSVNGSAGWVEADLPAEVCLSAVSVSASGAESEAVTDCAVPDYELFEGGTEPDGCNCSSSGSAGWVVLALLPALLLRRRTA